MRVVCVFTRGCGGSRCVAQLTEEAEDNIRFLGTLERHLRVIAAEAADPVQLFDAVTATLGPLLASLRLVWVLSIHYSDDSTMGALLQNITVQIGEPLLDCGGTQHSWLTGIAENDQRSLIGLLSLGPLPHSFRRNLRIGDLAPLAGSERAGSEYQQGGGMRSNARSMRLSYAAALVPSLILSQRFGRKKLMRTTVACR